MNCWKCSIKPLGTRLKFVEGLHNTNELLEMFNQASWNKTKIC